MKESLQKINEVFTRNFGRTPLNERIKDILGEAIELNRFTDLKNMKEEAGDLLCSLLQLFNENDWNPEDSINATLEKIESRKLQYQTLGRKTKVALLGGAFNPIHKGHIQVAQAVLNWSKTFDEVWLVPCYEHMNGKKLAPASLRLEWCNMAASVDGRIKAFDYEIQNKLKGETFHFIKRLLDEKFAKDQYDFSIIIGLDNANTFTSWVNYDYLEKMIRFVVVPRKGEKRDETQNWYLREPHIYLNQENEIMEMSSTVVRNGLKKLWSKDKNQEIYSEEAMQELEACLNPLVLKNILETKSFL